MPGDAALNARNPRLGSTQLQAIRFCTVGFVGFLVNVGVYSAQLDLMGTPPYLAAVGAFSVAMAHNHLVNRIWTFQARQAGYVAQGIRFLIVSLFALAINLAALQALLNAGVSQVEAQTLAIAAATPVAFFGNRSWTFRVRA